MKRFAVLGTTTALAATTSLAASLVTVPEGGWQTPGLPYLAVISETGHIQSLTAGGFDFLATGDAPGGLYMADGDTPVPFTAASVRGSTLRASSPRGGVTVEFAEHGLEITVENRTIANGHCLRLDISSGISRIRGLGRATEYPLPLRGTAPSPVRLIAPGGASLSMGEARSYHLDAGGSVARAGEHYVVKFPWVHAGTANSFTLPITTVPALADALQVKVSSNAADFTFWADTPRTLRTRLSNATQHPFEGDMLLKVRSYVTRDVVHEAQQEVRIEGGKSVELAWTVEALAPMLYMAEFWVASGGREELCCAPRFAFNAAKIEAPAPPGDFDAFWQQTLEEQREIPPDLQVEHVRRQGGHEVYNFSFAGLLGYRCYGWLTVPVDKSRKWPAVLVLPPAGMRSQPVPIFPAAVGMRININTVDVDLPPEQYDWRTWPAPYLVTGILDRYHYCLRFGYAATARAAEILAARPEVDPQQLRVTGSSQGGGLTFIAAGLYPGFQSATAAKPGLCRLDWNLDYLQPPFFPIAVNKDTRPAIANTLRYFLPSHFARHIQCPIDVSLGLYDDVTPAVGVFCAYNAVPHPRKTLAVNAQGGH